jgi:hypothetical protein
MDGGMVGWDLISLYKHMSGNDRVFIVYLMLIFAFSLARSLRLVWRLGFFSPASRVPSDQPKADASDLLVAIALANSSRTAIRLLETPRLHYHD